jgi:hypothetical protein
MVPDPDDDDNSLPIVHRVNDPIATRSNPVQASSPDSFSQDGGRGLPARARISDES